MIVCPFLGVMKEFKVLDLFISLLLLSDSLQISFNLILKITQILPSPTTGTFPAQSLNWKSNGLLTDHNEIKLEDVKEHLDFSFTDNHTTPPLFLSSVRPIFLHW